MARGASWLLVAALAACGCDDELVRVVVTSAGASVLDVEADVAATASERQTGLRGQAPLRPGHGLLLQFPVEGDVCLFNEGVGFSIDAVYAGADGAVAAVERAIPAGDPSARCHGGVQLVLEVGAGAATAVSPGDVLTVHDLP